LARRFNPYSAGGLSVRAFCQAEQVAESAFFFRWRTILERDAERRLPSRRLGGAIGAPAFLSVWCLATNATKQHRDRIGGGRMPRLEEAVAPQRLAEIVRPLERMEVGA